MDRQQKAKVHNQLRKVQLTKVHYKLRSENDKKDELQANFSGQNDSLQLVPSILASYSLCISSFSISSFSNSSFSNRINSNSSLISSSFSKIRNNSFQKAAYSFYMHTLEFKIAQINLDKNELVQYNFRNQLQQQLSTVTFTKKKEKLDNYKVDMNFYSAASKTKFAEPFRSTASTS